MPVVSIPLVSANSSADGRRFLLKFDPGGTPPERQILFTWLAGYVANRRASVGGKYLAFIDASWEGDILWVYARYLNRQDRLVYGQNTGLNLAIDAGWLQDADGNTTAAATATVTNRSLCNADGEPDTPNFPFEYRQYVDPQSGNDSRTWAQSQDSSTPVKTIRQAEQLYHANIGQKKCRAIFVKAGTVGQLSTASPPSLIYPGESRTKPVYVGPGTGADRYGSGAYPHIKNDDPDSSGLTFSGGGGTQLGEGFVVHGIKFEYNGSDPGGSRAAGIVFGHVTGTGVQASDVWIYDCETIGYINNIQTDGDPGTNEYVNISWTKMLDSRNVGGGHTAGLWVNHTWGLFLSEILWDRNGYKALDYSARDIFSRNFYPSVHNGPICVDNCWCFRSGSEGIQLRPGGGIRQSIFIAGSQYAFNPRGHIGECYGEGADDIDVDHPRGFGFAVQKSDPLGGTEVIDNESAMIERCCIADSTGSQKQAFDCASGHQDYVGPQYIRNCTAINHGPCTFALGQDTNDPRPLNFQRNLLKGPDHVVEIINSFEDYSDILASNYNIFNHGDFIARIEDVDKDFFDYATETGGDGFSIEVSANFVDEDARLADYEHALGGSTSQADLITRQRNRPLGDHSDQYEARRAKAFLSTKLRPTNYAALDSGIYGLRGCNLLQPPPAISAQTLNSILPTVSWRTVPHAVSYRLYRSTDNGATWSFLTETPGTSHSDIGGAVGTRYRATAVDPTGFESWHSTVATAQDRNTHRSKSRVTTTMSI